jgi:hypothetical protein
LRVPTAWQAADVLEAWDVVLEEDLADEFGPASRPGLVEDALEVILHGVGRDVQGGGDLLGGEPAEAEAGDVSFASG